ncbi:baseplate assembly protein [Pseudoalteromonas luteoviolacea]|uniref:Baseplate J-like C-terminal domain-containing protein n=1 Tax=Pseudoalteromonas luteoviolacea NCIMB 1942 TaxID=1365253 RepID=A0A167AQS5_9GAMM|nr:baseplate J/gp47 family protein [Pseudoalteromonas luteoviolacea]KZN45694.1 hypothetical protein N482_14190 [Pseudoalteromonas luteoviolacea NCIMB 1942]
MSLTNFSAIDLSRLPAPNLIEPLSYEKIRAEILDDFKTRFPDAELNLVSDPVIKLVESFAYRELLLRQRINESAHGVLLAHSSSQELDYLGNRFGVIRETVIPANEEVTPPQKAIMESDERFRERIYLALEGYSTAGPAGAYKFHTYAASPNIKDVHIDSPEFSYLDLPESVTALLPEQSRILNCTYSGGIEQNTTDSTAFYPPMPGDVVITVLSAEGSKLTQGYGKASEALKESVLAKLNRDDIRPLTDRVHVKSAEIIDFNVVAKLHLYPGMDGELVSSAAYQAAQAFLDDHHKLGHDVSLSGLYAALHQVGVQRVELTEPAADIVVSGVQVANCCSLTVVLGEENV